MKLLQILTSLKQAMKIEPERPPKEYCPSFSRDIQTANLNRVRVFSIVLFVVSALLIARDLLITRAAGEWEQNIGNIYLFYAHSTLMVTSVTFFFLAKFGLRNVYDKFFRNGIISLTFSFVILLWSAVLAGWVDQYFHGQITEYIIAMFGIAATIYFRPLTSIVLFAGIQCIFLGILESVLPEPNANGHITNSIVLSVLAWFLSRITYIMRLREFMNRHTIASQKADIERVNQELQMRNTYLAELNAEKNEFMGIAAHDLKNPLAAIMITSDITRRYWKNLTHKEIITNIDNIYTTAQKMKAIIINLLDTHAIESGAIRLNMTQFSLPAVVAAEIENYRERATAKNIQLHVQSIPEEIQIIVDEQILREVLDNLISNAVKYSPHGKNVYITSTLSAEHAIRITVKDEGQGISEADRTKLFGKFQRLTAKPTGGEHSTGLGLSIVKKLVEMMNGRVWCESEGAGSGAAFSIEFPAPNENDTKNLSVISELAAEAVRE
jgi:signal transduction histidine kinase